MARYPDPIDAAQHQAEQDLSRALAVRQPQGPAACGHCHWCGDALEHEARWCDAECRDAWDLFEDRERRSLIG